MSYRSNWGRTHQPEHIPGMIPVVSMVRNEAGDVVPEVQSFRSIFAGPLTMLMHFRALDRGDE